MEVLGFDLDELYNDYKYILKIILIIFGSIFINYILRTVVSRYFKRESARINVDPTAYNFLKNAASFIIFLIALLTIVYSIPQFKQLALTLFAGAGIIAAIIGFASQTAFSNIINGVMIVAFKPFRIGDVIEIGQREDYMGAVEEVTLRHTVIRNFENKRVIVPNTVISTEMIINRSIIDQKQVRFLDINIAHHSDLDLAIKILTEEAEKHQLLLDNRTEEDLMAGIPLVRVRVIELGGYFVKLRAYLWAKDSPDSFQIKTDLLKIIKERFDKEGIEIPFPYQHVHIINPEKPGKEHGEPEK